MAGFSSVTGDESIMFSDNCSFDGTQRGGKLTTNGQLFIGSSVSPHIKKGSLTSPLGTVNIGYSSPNITLDVANGVGPPQTPLRTISDFDDFLTTFPPTNPSPKLGFIGLSASWRPFAGTASNPGIIVNNLVTPDQSDAIVLDSDPASTASFLLGSCELTSNWICNLGTLSDGTNRYISYIGISDSSYIDLNNNGVSIPLNGCFFQYSDNVNSGNWQIVCGKSGSYTTVNTSTPASTGFHNYGIHINSTATIATFTIDGVTVGTTITTNIPNVVPVGPSILIENVSGTLLPFYVDLYYYLQILNTARPGTQTVWPGTMGFTSTNIQKFTTSGTYTPTANMKYCEIECVGGGAGGGGTAGNVSSFYVGGGGGGGGGYSRVIASAATIGVSQTVTIGAAGIGGAAGGANNGTNGSDTSVGSICIAKGGSGGLGGDGTNAFIGGTGGVSGTGDFTFPGNGGGVSSFQNPGNGTGRTALGGNSFFGQGGAESFYNMTGYGPGLPGTGYGGGGGGGLSVSNNATVSSGANGSPGVTIITEYI